MTKHPLTNKKLFKKFWDHTVDVTTEVLYTPDGMRAAADWQLEQVNDFFDKYRKTMMGVYPGYIPSLTELLSLMNQAMRPTQEDN